VGALVLLDSAEELFVAYIAPGTDNVRDDFNGEVCHFGEGWFECQRGGWDQVIS